MKKKENKKITGKEKISELIGDKRVVEVLFENGIMCMGCHAAPFETLEQGCKAHGMNKKEIDELIKKLNRK